MRIKKHSLNYKLLETFDIPPLKIYGDYMTLKTLCIIKLKTITNLEIL